MTSLDYSQEEEWEIKDMNQITLPKVKKAEYDALADQFRDVIKKFIKQEVKTCKKHWAKDGYDLSYDAIKEDLVFQLLGFDVGLFLIREICAKCDVSWVIRDVDGESVFRKQGLERVYYDSWTDEIVIVPVEERLLDLSLTSSAGYEFLGVL